MDGWTTSVVGEPGPVDGMASAANAAEVAWLVDRYESLVANVGRAVKGKEPVIRLAILCLISEGHLLIEDVPGVAKTLLAKAISGSCDARQARVQFTPDLLPADITGTSVYHQGTGRFEFHEGPVFANVVLGDEINRASPKTQSALLEVMEERQVTVDGRPCAVPRPFMVIATQNPVDHQGTYILPEAQVDRFMAKCSMGYPSHEAETEVLTQRTTGRRETVLTPVLGTADLERMIDIVRRVHIAPAIKDYIVTIAQATRTLPQVRLGVSPRGSVALAQATQGMAVTRGRPFVIVEDVKALAAPVLAHRMILTPEAELQGATALSLVESVLAAVPVPIERSPV